MEVPEISLLSTYNLQRILAERHSAVHRDEIVEDDDHGSAEDVDVKDEPSPNSVEEIAQIATECDLLSPVTRVHPAYKLLEPGNIRLLKIIQGRAGSDVYCHMGEFHIHAAPKYIALSYTWGFEIRRPPNICQRFLAPRAQEPLAVFVPRKECGRRSFRLALGGHVVDQPTRYHGKEHPSQHDSRHLQSGGLYSNVAWTIVSRERCGHGSADTSRHVLAQYKASTTALGKCCRVCHQRALLPGVLDKTVDFPRAPGCRD
jgi:hypothetical protein